MVQDKGVLYIATGGQYLKEALNSMETLKQETDLNCALITDKPVDHELIDKIIIKQNPKGKENIYFRLSNLEHSPFNRTLFLDSDTYINSDITNIFSILAEYDFAISHAPVRNVERVPEIPEWFPEYNGGVLLYKKNNKVQNFFNEWENNYDNLNFNKDQPSLRKTLFESNDINYFTLLPEYNMRTICPGYIDEEVKILHGRYSDLEETAKQFNKVTGRSVYYFRNYNPKVKTNHLTMSFKARYYLRNDGIIQGTMKIAKLTLNKLFDHRILRGNW